MKGRRTSSMKAFDFSRETELCAELDLPWSRIDGRTLLVTGATGMVGTYMIRVLLARNRLKGTKTRIIAVGRNREKFNARFGDCADSGSLVFLQHDVREPLKTDESPDFIVHMASNTHPRLYASDPIGTEMINILGTWRLLELAADHPGCRFAFTSSGDIYGDNRSGKERLEETDCGYIDCNTLRAGYIEGKRASEALCNAYRESRGVDFVIPRLCRIYGPTMDLTDSKAVSQFVLRAAGQEDIVLKSRGTQVFSYLYIFDVVSALLTVLGQGGSGEAYNIADPAQYISLRDLAELLAEIGGGRVVFDLPDELEKKGASTFQDVRLDPAKLFGLGWKPQVSLEEGLRHTVMKLRENAQAH